MARVGVKFKIVTEVRRTGSSESALQSYLETVVRPHLIDILQTNTADFTNRDPSGTMRVHAVPGVANRYFAYPKIYFEADTPAGAPRASVIARMDTITDLLAAEIVTDLVAGGATIIEQVKKMAGAQVPEE